MTSIYWLFLLSPFTQWSPNGKSDDLQRAPKVHSVFWAFVENSENLAVQPEVLATYWTDWIGSVVWLSSLPTKPADFLLSTCVAPFERETLEAHCF